MKRPANQREAGITVIEVVLMTVLIAILLLVLSEVVGTVSALQGRVHSQDLASTVSSKVMEEIRACGLASRNIFINDVQGQDFLAALDTSLYPVLTGSRLPLGDPTAPLVPDKAAETLTGNALLFAVQEPPVLITTTGGTYRIDHIRFAAFYLTLRSEKSVARRDDRIDLVRFTSGAHPEGPSIQAITDSGDRSEVVSELRARGAEAAWMPGVAVDQAFHELLSNDTMSATPVSSPSITTAPDGWIFPMFGSRRMSVAGNGDAHKVPLFAKLVDGKELFPSGFEVKVVGPASGRRLLTRLVLLASDPGGHDVVQEALRILTLRDL
jgi:hypothetical protein